jgi:hypothetical protein
MVIVLNSDVFMSALRDSLLLEEPPKSALPAEWTLYMSKRLLDLANRKNLHLCAISLAGLIEADDDQHQAREYLFDFTLFQGWKDYSLPIVVIEHENQWSKQAFLVDLWKILAGFAPLRVMFGYARDKEGVDSLVGAIFNQAWACKWKYPAGCEDLVLLGHGKMDRLDWRVIRRHIGESDWQDERYSFAKR